MNRKNHEFIVLAKFKEIAKAFDHEARSGQQSENRISIDGNVYYQFGDLRVELPNRTIIIEVESSGGITNLAKYWECIESGRLSKPVMLLHIYRQMSANDYKSHMVVWEFLCNKMQTALPGKFQGTLATYESSDIESLKPACEIFESWLSERPT